MDIGKIYDVHFEHVATEYRVKLLSHPGYISKSYDDFLFQREDGKEVFVRNFAKIVESDRGKK